VKAAAIGATPDLKFGSLSCVQLFIKDGGHISIIPSL
jgi:hypothetical protein